MPITYEKNAKEAALLARQLVRAETIGTLITINNETSNVPDGGHHTLTIEKEKAIGYPFGLPEYYIDLEELNGQPIFFISDLQKNLKNSKMQNKVSLTIRKEGNKIMDQHRICLTGNLSLLETNLIEKAKNKFIRKHEDSQWWIHLKDFKFYKLNINSIYWIGGFGNKHYIGDIPIEEYTSIHLKEEKIYNYKHPIYLLVLFFLLSVTAMILFLV